MKLGVCCGIDKAKLVKDAGYDYVEEHFTKINKLSDDDFNALVDEYKKIGIPVYATNCFFPGDFKLYEHEKEYFYDYVKRGFERVSKLGVKVCVIGSGGARMIPDGVKKEVALEKFTALLAYIADIAKDYGINIVIEPLETGETNFIHTVGEGASIANATGKDNVKVLVDFYHFYLNNEADDGLKKADGKLYHAHIARPNKDRKMPTEVEIPTIEKWSNLFKEVGYDIALSLEGAIDFESDLVKTKKIVDIFNK